MEDSFPRSSRRETRYRKYARAGRQADVGVARGSRDKRLQAFYRFSAVRT
jgi:hypothetical protein